MIAPPKFITSFLFRRSVDRIVDRRSRLTITFNPKVELPIELWRYLVKYRTNFRCEDCGDNKELDAHHIKPVIANGRNTLRNGRCLCGKCHPRYRTYPQKREERRNRTKRKLTDAFGFEKGNKIFEQYEKCRTQKEIRELIEKLVDENPEGVMEWLL